MVEARPLLVPLLIVVLWTFVPLAYAIPPDPTNVPGIWDDADYDDVVILTTSSSAATDSYTPGNLAGPLVAIALIPQIGHRLSPIALSRPYPPRSPPADWTYCTARCTRPHSRGESG